MSIIVESIDLPEDQRACMICRFLSEQGNCGKGFKVDQIHMTLADNKCPEFKPLLDSEF